MIDFYAYTTPNVFKVSIMLEEAELPYRIHIVDINTREQWTPEFEAISPNHKVPAIVDRDGLGGGEVSVFESGAILLYLAEKSGRFVPKDARGRYEVIEWLMYQMSTVGPMLGQSHHFRRFATEKVPYAIDRYDKEVARVYAVLEKRLAASEYLAGSEYSVADMATYPWIRGHEWHAVDLAAHPSVKRWYEEVGRRPAVQAGIKKTEEANAARSLG